MALRSGQIDQAKRDLMEAIDLDREAENLSGLAQDLALLAQVRQQQDDPRGALELYRQAQTIAEYTGQRDQVQKYQRAIDSLKSESDAPLQ